MEIIFWLILDRCHSHTQNSNLFHVIPINHQIVRFEDESDMALFNKCRKGYDKVASSHRFPGQSSRSWVSRVVPGLLVFMLVLSVVGLTASAIAFGDPLEELEGASVVQAFVFLAVSPYQHTHVYTCFWLFLNENSLNTN